MKEILNFTCLYVLLYFLLFSVVTPPSHLTKQEKRKFIIHLCTSIQAFISTTSCIYFYVTSENGANYTIPIPEEIKTITHQFIGFVFCDSVFGFFLSVTTPAMYFHHFVALIIFFKLLSTDSGNICLIIILVGEGTTTCYQTKSIFWYLRLHNTRLAKWNEFVFVSVFLFFRVILYWFMMANSWIMVKNDPFLQVTFLLGYWLGIVWCYQRIAENYFGVNKDLKYQSLYQVTGLLFLVLWSIVIPNFIIYYYEKQTFYLSISRFNVV